MLSKTTATITFKSLTTWALWKYEVLGQLSDGKWENTSPLDHWKFWCNAEVKLGDVDAIVAEPGWYATRVSYDIVALMNDKWDSVSDSPDGSVYILRDRMLAIGRFAKVLSENGGLSAVATDRLDAAFSGTEYAPPTVEEFLKKLSEAGSGWKADYLNALVETGFLFKFYAAVYTPKDLKRDLLIIKNMMKTVHKL